MSDKQAVIGHFDVTGPELDRLSAFYGTVFGWDVTSRGPGYAQVSTPQLNGALAETPEASLTIGVIVVDLDEALEKAVQAGGSVVMPATDNGWVTKATVLDPAGNAVTLIQK
ncbi:VOC family protein [Microbacterium sp. SORGH_AS_0888]|uniref:VOC family protein n=1 Tax=Microbacterium sp. SORGH_AS_0888 TaxID=3041791 RepID=UPI002782B6BE|nr:VOC family protein [Microbacterium sp. SORGH_AS_0888]MDQ1130701.1 putative enzyme related to lactoylglutathione lyase [Microbacterium sp. SORGH_AS_0888]